MDICGDNRFEIIAKAKEHLLDATNIDTSEDEMKVLDSFLFRCWQMGWLDRYDTADRKTEPQTDCEFCQNHEQGDTLYEPSDWDGGIGFDYIRDIKYCPLCGSLLDGEREGE